MNKLFLMLAIVLAFTCVKADTQTLEATQKAIPNFVINSKSGNIIRTSFFVPVDSLYEFCLSTELASVDYSCYRKLMSRVIVAPTGEKVQEDLFAVEYLRFVPNGTQAVPEDK